MTASSGMIFLPVVLLAFLNNFVGSRAQLAVGFYDASCPAAEIIVKQEVSKGLSADVGVAPGLIRLHFHDCFVRGCDASVLIDSTPGNTAEKDAPPNKSLKGFDVIDKAKTRLEQACFGIVSCADILAFAARDSVVLTGGKSYGVRAGRRDGNVSRAAETSGNLPPPSAELDELARIFASKGFSAAEMVTLSGAHTIGMSHCSSFSDRLYQFSRTSSQDPTIDPGYVAQLMQKCPKSSATGGPMVAMDPATPTIFDANYYSDLIANRGLFISDQALMTNQSTAGQVLQYASNGNAFLDDFAAAMVKMGDIGALTGSDGEIRTSCRAIN